MRAHAPGKEDVRLRRKAAAFRLRHDLGKYIRFNARGEEDVEALRERLRLDVLFTRRNGSLSRNAVQIWEEWRNEDGTVFDNELKEDSDLLAIEEAMRLIRSLLPDLSTLEEARLRDLDEASAQVARHSLFFYERVLSSLSSPKAPS